MQAIEHAALYLIQKQIEALLKDRELPPGNYDVSGQQITITLPAIAKVSRDAGRKGDGRVEKKATQNLYGWAVWALLFKRLKKFNQMDFFRRIVKEVWEESVRNPQTSVEEKLKDIDPELDEFLTSLKKAPGPMRSEATPRQVEIAEEGVEIAFGNLELVTQAA